MNQKEKTGNTVARNVWIGGAGQDTTDQLRVKLEAMSGEEKIWFLNM